MISGWIFCAFKSRSPEVLLTLYKALVRPILEYCCLVWYPTKIGDIQVVENVQRAFTRKIQGMKNLDYWQRLEALDLISLQRRRQRYELIHVWKITRGLFTIVLKWSSRRVGWEYRRKPRNILTGQNPNGQTNCITLSASGHLGYGINSLERLLFQKHFLGSRQTLVRS